MLNFRENCEKQSYVDENWFFTIFSKSKNSKAYVASQSQLQYKCGSCGYISGSENSLHPSGAEIHLYKPQKINLNLK